MVTTGCVGAMAKSAPKIATIVPGLMLEEYDAAFKTAEILSVWASSPVANARKHSSISVFNTSGETP